MRRRLLKRIKLLLWQTSHHPAYLPLISLLSIAATLSMAIPTTAILIPAVVLRPHRWQLICLAAVVGAGSGSTLLAYGFRQEGWAQLQAHYPDLIQSASWQNMTQVVNDYGLFALAVISGLPLPQTPALVMCALSGVPMSGIFLAIAAGKLAKYGLLAWAVATFPERFLQYLHRDDEPKARSHTPS